MKVLFVTHYTSLYGANRSMLQMIIELREKGVDPTVYLPGGIVKDKELSLVSELIKNDIPYYELPVRMIKSNSFLKLIPNYFYTNFVNKQIACKVSVGSYDIIHSNSSVLNLGAYIARHLSIPHVWHLREFGDLDYKLKTPFGSWFQRYIYRGNNCFIAISKKILSHYRPFILKQPIKLVYNGVNVESSGEHTYSDKVRFCIVGVISPQKGQFDVIKAVELLVNKFGFCDFHLTVIGGCEERYLTTIQKYIIDHHLESFITMTGPQNNVPKLLEHMDVGIMASSNEAFGRVTIEYMMAGLAVIASDGGANNEIIRDQYTGLIYKRNCIEDLSKKMAFLINNRRICKILAKRGYERAVKEFSSTRNSDMIYDIYKSILKNR